MRNMIYIELAPNAILTTKEDDEQKGTENKRAQSNTDMLHLIHLLPDCTLVPVPGTWYEVRTIPEF